MSVALKAPMATWILDPVDALDSPHAGGKARALARAARSGLSVPAWVVLSDGAFLQSNSSTLSGMPEGEVRSAIEAAVRTLCPKGERLAVRSSACDEDGVQVLVCGTAGEFLERYSRGRRGPGQRRLALGVRRKGAALSTGARTSSITAASGRDPAADGRGARGRRGVQRGSRRAGEASLW